MVIETSRLIVRPFIPEDAADLYEYLSDPEVVFYEPYGVLTEEICQKEALRRSTDSAFWAVCLKENKKLIGNLYLSKQNCDTWELGYVFSSNYQGKGHAAESAAALITHAFKCLEAHRVEARCNPANGKSWRLLERLGLRREGHLIQSVFFKRDKDNRPLWHDTYIYAVLSSEWSEAAHTK